jgi:predicted TIM-barrel enzyme/transcriptional regulator with AAA-type ATPase domain
MPNPRDALIDRLSRRRGDPTAPADRRRFCVGAAIGTGMAAQSAMRGGADFLLALSAGRVRNMGEPSIAAMLPLLETNALVMSFARQEILPRATVPVFFGAASFHPGLNLDALVAEIADAGFCGIANFPTAILIDGAYRQFLEDAGLGFNRELKLLEIAKQKGLATLAYTHTLEEARAAAERGLDLVNIDLGWNMGGVLGVDSDLRIEEAALMANTIARAVHAASPDTLCVVEGGPIVNPRQLEEVCQIARVDGYIGGSTIDRVPSESAIEVVTAAFKAIGALHQRVDGLERWRDRGAFPLTLWGCSPAVESAREMFARLAATDHPVLVVGEPGSGRRSIVRALHTASARRSRNLVSLCCREPAPGRLRLDLFGCMAGAHPSVIKHRLGWLEASRGSSMLLEDLEALDIEVQRQLAEAVEAGRFWRLGGETPIPLDVRMMATSESSLSAACDLQFEPRFVEWINRFAIVVPPLRERIDDLPILINEALNQIQLRAEEPRKSLDPSAYRALASYHWPGNLRELIGVLERAVVVSPSQVITPDHLPPLDEPEALSRGVSAFESEKAWVLDGLRRNRYRRGKTAAYLGISRKTLYNKMRRYGLLPAAHGMPDRARS